MKKRIFWVLLLGACLAAIFFFSSQNYYQTNNTSGKISMVIVQIAKDVGAVPAGSSTAYQAVNVCIRKIAHFTIFFLLGVNISMIVWTFGHLSNSKRLVISLAAGFICACGDEFHQQFVMARTSSFRDVCIDTAGVLLAVFIVRSVEHRKHSSYPGKG